MERIVEMIATAKRTKEGHVLVCPSSPHIESPSSSFKTFVALNTMG